MNKKANAAEAHALIQLGVTVADACLQAGISRQGYYDHFRPKVTAAERIAKAKAGAARAHKLVKNGHTITDAIAAEGIGKTAWGRYVGAGHGFVAAQLKADLAIEIALSGVPVPAACALAGTHAVNLYQHYKSVRITSGDVEKAVAEILAAGATPTAKALMEKIKAAKARSAA